MKRSQILKLIVGDDNRFSVSHRVLNATAFLGIVLTLSTTVANYLLMFPLKTVMFSFVSLIYFAVIYLISIRLNKFRLVYNLMSTYLVFCFIPVSWIFNAGSTGGFHYFVFFFLIIIATTTANHERWFYSLSLILVGVGLLFLEYFSPQYIIYYNSSSERLTDVVISFVIAIISIVAATEIFMKVYRKGVVKLQLQKKEIEAQAFELIRTNRKLHELTKFKEEMMGMIVHDLKNPINILLNSSVLKDTEYFLPTIETTSKQMLNLVNNILDVHKYEHATFQLVKSPVELKYLVDCALEDVRFLVECKGLKVSVELSLDSKLDVDSENLLSNAIKFSSQQETIFIKQEVFSEGFVRLSVTNIGCYIPIGQQTMIFECYTQGERRNSGQTPSTGLGLAFCKLAIEAHGGQIGVNSSEQSDEVVFWFTLPS